MASSQDSSSDSSTSSPQHPYDGPNIREAENLLPGVLMCTQSVYAYFFCQLQALGSTLEFPPLRDGARDLLQLMPADTTVVDRLLHLFSSNSLLNVNMETMFFSALPSEVK